jgi:outer membrane biosynthesis protein TonB
MKRLLACALALTFAGCAAPAAPSAASAERSEPEPRAEPRAAAASPEPSHEPPPAPHPSSTAVPALSSPNALATTKSDAGADADATPVKEDARTAAIRRVAVAARSCYTTHVGGARGKLMLRIGLGDDGHVTKALIDAQQTSAALRAEPFQKCVLETARKETFPAPKGEEVELELPLVFEPSP